MKHNQPILVSALLGGFSSLVYELVWTRYLALILGSSAYAVGVVTACYMAGLALGGFLLGRWADRQEVWARRIAFGGFGLLCALSPLLYRAVNAVHLLLAQGVEHSGALLAIRVLAASAALLPPTLCIGGMTPMLVKRYRESRGSTLVYAIFTLGSVGGAITAGFFLIPLLGLGGSCLIGGLCALVAMVLPWGTGRPTAASPAPPPTPIGAPYPNRVRWCILALYALSGFTAMAYQMYQTKLLTLFFMDSVYDFALILTIFLASLFLGNCLGDRLAARGEHPLLLLALGQAAIGLSCILSLFFAGLLPAWTDGLLEGPLAVGLLVKSGYTLLVVLPPALLWGSVFPLASKVFLQGKNHAATRAGILTGWNTVGSALGALLGSFLLIAAVGLRGAILLGALLNVAAAVACAALCLYRERGRAWLGPVALGLTAALTVALLPSWNRFEMSTSFLKPGQAVTGAVDMLYYREDAYGITSVAHFLPSDQKYLTTNRLYCQSTADLGGAEDHRRLGYIPLLLHPEPEAVLVTGLGSGVTLRGVAEAGGGQIDCVEIAPAVVEAAAWFREENDAVLERDNVQVIVEDARNYILRTQTQYDVVVGDIFFPMSSGSSNLFSREYYQSVRDRLKEGGLMVQWLPIHQFAQRELELTANTFSHVFPNSYYFLGMIGSSVPVVGLVGSETPLAVDFDRLQQTYQDRQGLARTLGETALDDPYMLLSHYIGKIEPNQGPIVTDSKPLLEYLNPREDSSYLQRGRSNLAWLTAQKSPAEEITLCSQEDGAVLAEYDDMIVDFISLFLDGHEEVADRAQRW